MNDEVKKIRVFEGFAGYGGASFGLKRSKIPHEVIGYSEVLPKAIELFELNHKNIPNYGDITKIKPEELPDFDFFTGGFPCQTFSSAGNNKGELDTRGTLFNDIIRICEIKKPKYILLENVKGLLSKRHKQTFSKIISELERIGYNVKYELLNTKDYGVPQNRERVWIFATSQDIPEDWELRPEPEELKYTFSDFLDENVESKYYKNKEQTKRVIELTNVDMNVDEPVCLDIYNKRIRKDKLCMTLTEPHHNTTRVVEPKEGDDFKMRKLTEREHFRLMGFRDDEINLGDLSYTQACRAAGNGWDVNLVEKLMNKIYELIELKEEQPQLIINKK